MKKYKGASKKEWLSWIDSELSVPVIVSGDLLNLLEAFKSLLTDKKEKRLIELYYQKALNWTEDERRKMLKPDWINLTDQERHVYKAYIEAYDDIIK